MRHIIFFSLVLSTCVVFAQETPVVVELVQEESPSDLRFEATESAPYLTPETAVDERYVRVDALFMKLGRGAAGQPVVIRTVDENFNSPGPTLISSNEVGRGRQTGPQITLGRLNGDGLGWEAAYFGLFGGSQSKTVTGDNDLAIPGALGLSSLDFFGSDIMTVTSSGELHSVEFNAQERGDFLTTLWGVRYLRTTDTLNILSGDPDTSGSDYHVRSANNLYGAQLGLRHARRGPTLGWDVTGKAGVFANSASTDQYVTDSPNPNPVFYLRDPQGDATTTLAFVGEIDAGVTVQITSAVAFRAGYKLLWLDGVASASDQLDFNSPGPSTNSIETHGGMFLHGATAGLEARW